MRPLPSFAQVAPSGCLDHSRKIGSFRQDPFQIFFGHKMAARHRPAPGIGGAGLFVAELYADPDHIGPAPVLSGQRFKVQLLKPIALVQLFIQGPKGLLWICLCGGKYQQEAGTLLRLVRCDLHTPVPPGGQRDRGTAPAPL